MADTVKSQRATLHMKRYIAQSLLLLACTVRLYGGKDDDWSFKSEQNDWRWSAPNNDWDLDGRARKQNEALRGVVTFQPLTSAVASNSNDPLDKVAVGMTATEVRGAIGAPKATDAEFWIVGNGYIEFSASNRVNRIRRNEIAPKTTRSVVAVTGLAPSTIDGYYTYVPQNYGQEVSPNYGSTPNFFPSSYQPMRANRDVLVRGYNRNGRYIAPYHRTAPNRIRTDNYSHRGNVNPYTGKIGTRK